MRRDRDFGLGSLVGIFGMGLVVVGLALTPMSCQDRETAARALSQAGYTQVEWTGYRWFAGEDTFKTGFRAVSPNGTSVSGYVSNGWMKGATIRTD